MAYVSTTNVEVKFTVIGLIADIHGDETQGKLPAGYAMRITYALLREDTETLERLRAECAGLGWGAYVDGLMNEADLWRNTHQYCVTGAACLARV